MPATIHRVNAVADALEATLKAWPGLAGVPVYNGQDPQVYAENEAVAVAASESPEDPGEVMRYRAEWVTTGPMRGEEGEITCILIVQRGEASATAKALRQRASTLLGEVEQALHDGRGQLAGTVPGLMWVTVSEASYTVVATSAGMGVQIRFVVSYKGRFGPTVS